MRLLSASLLLCTAALGGCGLLGLGAKRSPYDGVLRLDTEARVPAYAPVRLAVQNDGPSAAAFDPCTRLLLQRFSGLGWMPVRGYRACASAPAVTLAPGQGTVFVLPPVPPGQAYRVVLLSEGATAEDPARGGRRRLVQSTAPFDAYR